MAKNIVYTDNWDRITTYIKQQYSHPLGKTTIQLSFAIKQLHTYIHEEIEKY